MLFPIKDYNPTRRRAYLTVILIAINIGVFFFQLLISDRQFGENIASGALVPKEITHFRNYSTPYLTDEKEIKYYKRDIHPVLSLTTSIFMHGSLLHLFGNMLFLWIFGNNIEDYLGRFKFLLFYLASGIGASLVHVIFNWNSVISVIGASGAVSGIMGAYLILFPRARVRTLIILIIFVTFADIPAFVFLLVWFVFQFFLAGSGSSVAWLAHVGGFLIGVLLIKWLKKKKPIVELIQ